MSRLYKSVLLLCGLVYAGITSAAPTITGEPIIVQHLGKLDWPQDDLVTTTPFLTQLVANDINDLHGDVSCDLIISTPGNYHMALRDAMKGSPNPAIGFPVGLQEQLRALHVTVCWSTSPPVGPDQIPAEDLQFKNIHLKGRPALAMGPGKVMNTMINNGLVDPTTRMPFLKNRGNAMLVRADKADSIHNVCDLGGNTRVVTPSPTLEPGSFGNFSSTIYDIANANPGLGCDPTTLFNSIFSQDIGTIDTSSFDNPYNIPAIQSEFASGQIKWVASSRIMHRDIPYALCHNEADAGVIFYHLAKYNKEELQDSGCDLKIVNLDGSSGDSKDVPGNHIGTLFVAKVIGHYNSKVEQARDIVYDFMTSSPIWTDILNDHGIDSPAS